MAWIMRLFQSNTVEVLLLWPDHIWVPWRPKEQGHIPEASRRIGLDTLLLSALIQINGIKLIRWQPKHSVKVTSENKHQQSVCPGREPRTSCFWVLNVWQYNWMSESAFLSVCSWWGPVLTCSVWCPSWSSSLFRLWSSFSQSSSSSSQRCCPPPLRQSRKRHVHTHIRTAVQMIYVTVYDYATWHGCEFRTLCPGAIEV